MFREGRDVLHSMEVPMLIDTMVIATIAMFVYVLTDSRA
jgi:hypothetical protein